MADLITYTPIITQQNVAWPNDRPSFEVLLAVHPFNQFARAFAHNGDYGISAKYGMD